MSKSGLNPLYYTKSPYCDFMVLDSSWVSGIKDIGLCTVIPIYGLSLNHIIRL